MPDDIPDLTTEGGYLYSPDGHDIERVWELLSEETEAVVRKLVEKQVITHADARDHEDSPGVSRRDLYATAENLDRVVKGSARIRTRRSGWKMYYAGYSSDSHHAKHTMHEQEAYTSTRVGKIVEHKLMSLHHSVDWDGDPGHTVSW